MIRRSFATLTPDIVIPMHLSLARPHLEYAIQASSTCVKQDVDHLERLQRLATRMVKCCRCLSHEERFEKLNFLSLAHRRLKGDSSLAYNLPHGSLDLLLEEFFTIACISGIAVV